MTSTEISNHITRYLEDGKKVFTTSSFQTHSLPLLHILSKLGDSISFYFLDTGFHFPETLMFRDQVAEQFGIEVNSLRSGTPKFQQRDAKNRFLFTTDPDFCCHLNKIQPLDPVLMNSDVWVAGVRRDQSLVRKEMQIEQPSKFECIRFHPILDWDSRDIERYIKEFDLPRHPLEDQGYFSVGCEPCTRKFDFEIESDERLGRWFGMNKTECGLHTELAGEISNKP